MRAVNSYFPCLGLLKFPFIMWLPENHKPINLQKISLKYSDAIIQKCVIICNMDGYLIKRKVSLKVFPLSKTAKTSEAQPCGPGSTYLNVCLFYCWNKNIFRHVDQQWFLCWNVWIKSFNVQLCWPAIVEYLFDVVEYLSPSTLQYSIAQPCRPGCGKMFVRKIWARASAVQLFVPMFKSFR